MAITTSAELEYETKLFEMKGDVSKKTAKLIQYNDTSEQYVTECSFNDSNVIVNFLLHRYEKML